MNTTSSLLLATNEMWNVSNTEIEDSSIAELLELGETHSNDTSSLFAPFLSTEQDRYSVLVKAAAELDDLQSSTIDISTELTDAITPSGTPPTSDIAPKSAVLAVIASTDTSEERIEPSIAARIAAIHTSPVTEPSGNSFLPMAAPAQAERNATVDALMDTVIATEPLTPLTGNPGPERSIAVTRWVSDVPQQRLISPLAGSSANHSDEVLPTAQQDTPDEQEVTSDYVIPQRRGKFVPPSGNVLPGSLLFFKNTNEGTIQPSVSLDTMFEAVSNKVQPLPAFGEQTQSQQLTDSNATAATTSLDPFTGSGRGNVERDQQALNTEINKSFVIKAAAGSPDWTAQIGDRVRWLTRANISTAELVLHPAELGTIEVKIITENDQTKVSFFSATAATREVIEATLPKLRDLLEHSGLQLGQSEVSQKNHAKQDPKQEFGGQRTAEDELESVAENVIKSVPLRSLNQIDHYI